MKAFRTDDPRTNPAFRVGPNKRPRRDHRTLRADAGDLIRDAKDVTAARRDAALAVIRDQHKNARRGFSRDDLKAQSRGGRA